MPTIFRASLAPAAILALLAACTSSNPTADAGPGTQLCPVTIEQATTAPGTEGVTSACHVDDYKCFVGFQCGNFTQQANCVCDGATFSCTLENGKQVQQGDDSTTLCQSIISDGGTDTCPTDKTTAGGTPCKNAGQQCTYPSACTTNPAPLDVCQCKGNELGDAGLSWSCDINCP